MAICSGQNKIQHKIVQARRVIRNTLIILGFHHCVVIFFWSSGIMECTCMLFTFENGVHQFDFTQFCAILWCLFKDNEPKPFQQSHSTLPKFDYWHNMYGEMTLNHQLSTPEFFISRVATVYVFKLTIEIWYVSQMLETHSYLKTNVYKTVYFHFDRFMF